jgi:hypothetical protein
LAKREPAGSCECADRDGEGDQFINCVKQNERDSAARQSGDRDRNAEPPNQAPPRRSDPSSRGCDPDRRQRKRERTQVSEEQSDARREHHDCRHQGDPRPDALRTRRLYPSIAVRSVERSVSLETDIRNLREMRLSARGQR